MEELKGERLEVLLKSNVEYTKQSTLFEKGGNYSKDEIEWYKDMLKEINEQLSQQMVKRGEKKEEIIKRVAISSPPSHPYPS